MATSAGPLDDLTLPDGYALSEADGYVGLSCNGYHALDRIIGLDPAGRIVVADETIPAATVVPPEPDEWTDTYVAWALYWLETEYGANLNGQRDVAADLLNELDALRPGPSLREMYERYGLGDPAERTDTADEELDLLNYVDLGAVMRNGITPPDMLEEQLVVKGCANVWFGMKECGKTWIAAWLAGRQLMRGRTVVWVDKEMGRQFLAERFETLGVPADVVSRNLVYLEMPVLTDAGDVRAAWEQMLDGRKPALVIVDAQMEVLADADLNENSTADVLRWLSWYFGPAHRRGVTTVMLDHTGHDSQGRTRGASGKGQAAKVELEFSKPRKFDRETVGAIAVTRRKNTPAADIPEVQWFDIGGTSEGFILERCEVPPAGYESAAGNREAAKFATKMRIRESVVNVLTEHGSLTRSQLDGMVTGNAATLREVLAELVEDDDSGIGAAPGTRAGSVRYFVK